MFSSCFLSLTVKAYYTTKHAAQTARQRATQVVANGLKGSKEVGLLLNTFQTVACAFKNLMNATDTVTLKTYYTSQIDCWPYHFISFH